MINSKLFILVLPFLFFFACNNTDSASQVTKVAPVTTTSTPVSSQPIVKLPAQQASSIINMPVEKIKAYESVQPIIFSTTDVPEKDVVKTKKFIDYAVQFWLTTDAPAFQKFNPFYIAIVGTDPAAAKKLNEEMCAYSEVLQARCDSDPGFKTAIVPFVQDEQAALISHYKFDGFHLLALSDAHIEGYEPMVLHEVFHVYQLANIALTKKTSKRDINSLEAKSVSDIVDQSPWWMESSANYMANLLYARRPETSDSYLTDTMNNYLGQDDAKQRYINDNRKIYDYGYGDEYYQYGIGDWFIAYLVSIYGEQSIHDFYEQLPIIDDFEDTFIAIFKKSYTDHMNDFDEWFKQSNSELLKILPAIVFP